jgi:hypothetical protein
LVNKLLLIFNYLILIFTNVDHIHNQALVHIHILEEEDDDGEVDDEEDDEVHILVHMLE